MEYEFRRNGLDGSLLARFSMEHEVMGRWFGEELCDNQAAISEVLMAIEALIGGSMTEWRRTGREFSVELDTEQARVYANVLGLGQDEELDEGLALYDSELEAGCGLEDLQRALLSWQQFLKDSR